MEGKKHQPNMTNNSKGSALVLVIIVLAMIMAISLGVLAVSSSESQIAGSDWRRTDTFYASVSGIEVLTNKFIALTGDTTKPTTQQLDAIEQQPPAELVAQGFSYNLSITEDTNLLNMMRLDQFGTTNTDKYPSTTIEPGSSLEGLNATIVPYIMSSQATHNATGSRVTVQRSVNSYSVPLFQFGIFGDMDVAFHPGPKFTFNGRIHSNRNLYLGGGDVTFQKKITSANEISYNYRRNGSKIGTSSVKVYVGSKIVTMNQGTVMASDTESAGGPHYNNAGTQGDAGYFPDSGVGVKNPNWATNSVLNPVSGNTVTPNRFNRQVLSRITGARRLQLPLQLDGSAPREIIERPAVKISNGNNVLAESDNLSESRYFNKAQIRILIDNEDVDEDEDASSIDAIYTKKMGLPEKAGVALSEFNPAELDGGKALYKVSGGSYDTTVAWRQMKSATDSEAATRVRSAKTSDIKEGSAKGAGLRGRIVVQIVDGNNVARDVTKEVLSMGMTVGEPNAIVQLQRPMWAAFIPLSASRTATGSNLVDIINNSYAGVDGEINSATVTTDGTTGTISTWADDDLLPTKYRNFNLTNDWNRIVPINIYNAREGWSAGWKDDDSSPEIIRQRGMMSLVELNMRNLTRWISGHFDSTLFKDTNAVSSNIKKTDGIIVYVSDRRGDRPKEEYAVYSKDGTGISGTNVLMSNGQVDNEDIYSNDFNAAATLEPGEDVISYGLEKVGGQWRKRADNLQNDTTELPKPSASYGDFPLSFKNTNLASKITQARDKVLPWNNMDVFRRGVRLFNGEDLIPDGSTVFSNENGITVATENMIYIGGSYNTTGIAAAPPAGLSTEVEGYGGDQVPASIVVDAFSPLSRTWFDALSLTLKDGRTADQMVDKTPSRETAVRCAVIAGITRGALAGKPDQGNTDESRMDGGVHNFPRFMENWAGTRFNYVGSLIMLYYSNQAMGAYNANGIIYGAPDRNWAFDTTFLNPKRLPPGTPSFNYVEPTGFRQVITPTNGLVVN